MTAVGEDAERAMSSLGREGIPMLRDEVVASLVFGAMVTFVFALVWGRQFVDLITAGF